MDSPIAKVRIYIPNSQCGNLAYISWYLVPSSSFVWVQFGSEWSASATWYRCLQLRYRGEVLARHSSSLHWRGQVVWTMHGPQRCLLSLCLHPYWCQFTDSKFSGLELEVNLGMFMFISWIDPKFVPHMCHLIRPSNYLLSRKSPVRDKCARTIKRNVCISPQ